MVSYDVVCVGAGIAGLYAGWKLAAAGRRVCIVDRRAEIGLPVRCGEATGNRAELRRFMDVDESWIATDVAGLAVHIDGAAPLCRRIPDTGVVLRRERFEQELARRALGAGAELRLRTTVTALVGPRGTWSGVRCADGDTVEARVVIGADGPESRVGRWSGICGPLRLDETYSAAQYRLHSDCCAERLLHFYVGQHTAGHGYVWVFPRGTGDVSVGAGLYGGTRDGRSALGVLDAFLGTRFPGSERRELICGCAPVSICPSRLSIGNVAVVGDAARQVNPLTAGGIMNTLEAADLLVSCLLGLRAAPPEALRRYSARWRRRMRFEQKVFLLLQRVFLDCTDADLGWFALRAEAVCRGMEDRSRPFRWPALPLLRLGALLSRRALRHLPLLLG